MEKQPKGPSLSALAALTTLAVSLWLEVGLASALFRSVLVYLGLSMLIMAYRVVLGRFIAATQAKVEREILENARREAEEERQRVKAERQEKERRESVVDQKESKKKKHAAEEKQEQEVAADH